MIVCTVIREMLYQKMRQTYQLKYSQSILSSYNIQYGHFFVYECQFIKHIRNYCTINMYIITLNMYFIISNMYVSTHYIKHVYVITLNMYVIPINMYVITLNIIINPCRSCLKILRRNFPLRGGTNYRRQTYSFYTLYILYIYIIYIPYIYIYIYTLSATL